MELQEMFRICKSALLGHLLLILTVTVLACLTAVALTYVIPEKYEATALVLILPQEKLDISRTGEKEMLALPATGSTLQVETPSRTYIEVIKSRAVAEQIVRRLNLDRSDDAVEPNGLAGKLKHWLKSMVFAARDIVKYGRTIAISPFERAVRDLRENLSLTAVRNTFVFQISFRSGDPTVAAEVANTAASVFREIHANVQVLDARNHLDFIETRVADIERELERARSALREFKQQYITASFVEERTERIKRISELSTSLNETRAELSGLESEFTDSNSRILRLRAKARSLESELNIEQEVLNQLPEQEMKLADLELEVSSLTSTYQALKSKLEDARINEAKSVNEIRVVSPATPPVYPSTPIKLYYAGAASILGLLVGIGIALIADTRLTTVEDVESALQLSVLTTTPKLSSPV